MLMGGLWQVHSPVTCVWQDSLSFNNTVRFNGYTLKSFVMFDQNITSNIRLGLDIIGRFAKL